MSSPPRILNNFAQVVPSRGFSWSYSLRPLIAGNWKMHGRSPQLGEIEAIATSVKNSPPSADVLLCVPQTLIDRAARLAAGRIAIGGETCDAKISGPFTGDVSAEMLADAGATAVIVGHSERRQVHAETNAMVMAKARAAKRAGLLAVICIGETKLDRLAGRASVTCRDQIAGSLPADMDAVGLAIGYEPLWAIGTGQLPTAEEISDIHARIRECLVANLGAEGSMVRILYGGSVKPDNAAAILALPEVGGALVGGASLRAVDFEAIIRAVPEHQAGR